MGIDMFKLTDEQKEEVIKELDRIYNDCIEDRYHIEQFLDMWHASFQSFLDFTMTNIRNYIDKIRNDKDYELSKDFLRMAIIYDIANSKNKKEN